MLKINCREKDTLLLWRYSNLALLVLSKKYSFIIIPSGSSELKKTIWNNNNCSNFHSLLPHSIFILLVIPLLLTHSINCSTNLFLHLWFQLAKNFGNEFINHIEEYLGKVVNRLQYDIGRCWPVSQAYNATVIAGCNRILSPFVSIYNSYYFISGGIKGKRWPPQQQSFSKIN